MLKPAKRPSGGRYWNHMQGKRGSWIVRGEEKEDERKMEKKTCRIFWRSPYSVSSDRSGFSGNSCRTERSFGRTRAGGGGNTGGGKIIVPYVTEGSPSDKGQHNSPVGSLRWRFRILDILARPEPDRS